MVIPLAWVKVMARPGLRHGQREVVDIILLNWPRHGEPWSISQFTERKGRQEDRQKRPLAPSMTVVWA